MTSSRKTFLVALLMGVFLVAACGSEEVADEEGTGVECTVDSDCPGLDNRCDLASHTCTGGSGEADSGEGTASGTDTGRAVSDTGHSQVPDAEDSGGPAEETGGGEDTGESRDGAANDSGSTETGVDTSPEDVVGEDSSSPDGDVRDSGAVDTASPDTASDTGGNDAGNPFSGCTSDADCSGYLVCDQTLGRCEDPRPRCSSNSDCASSEYCVAGRCLGTCPLIAPCPQGLECKQFGGSGGVTLCAADCNTFDGSGSDGCEADRQCVPFFGADDGLCRGVGRNRAGQSCSSDFSADDCREGSFCVENRAEQRCQKLCADSGAPNCGSGAYCADRFTLAADDTAANNPAGFCFDNCGGLGSTDDTLCSSGKACQPDTASEGFCTTSGSVGAGGTCGSPGSPYCETGNYCLPTTSQNQGVCRGACDPNNSEASNVCASGEACVEVDTDFGLCVTMCSDTGGTTSQCPSERPYCAGVDSSTNTTPSTPGICLESSP